MKSLFPFLVAIVCAVSALQAAAATQSQSPNGTSVPSAEQQAKGVRTGDWEYATPQMIPLDPQPVRSWGGAVLPGPRNTHVSAAHGGLITAGDRSNVFGRE
jgi:hypothetical protein